MSENETSIKPVEAKYQIEQITLKTLGDVWSLEVKDNPPLTLEELANRVTSIRESLFTEGLLNLQIPVGGDGYLILGKDAVKNMVMHVKYEQVVEPTTPP